MQIHYRHIHCTHIHGTHIHNRGIQYTHYTHIHYILEQAVLGIVVEAWIYRESRVVGEADVKTGPYRLLVQPFTFEIMLCVHLLFVSVLHRLCRMLSIVVPYPPGFLGDE